ncbi:MAG: hypothetical protein ACREX9_06240 [Gammaproteobacteria bacterium]
MKAYTYRTLRACEKIVVISAAWSIPRKGSARFAIVLARIGGYRSFSGDLGEQKL